MDECNFLHVGKCADHFTHMGLLLDFIVRKLGADPGTGNKHGDTPLGLMTLVRLSCESDSYIKFLEEASLHHGGNRGSALLNPMELNDAIASANVSRVQYLIERGADVNDPPNNVYSAIGLTVHSDKDGAYSGIIKLLLDAGAKLPPQGSAEDDEFLSQTLFRHVQNHRTEWVASFVKLGIKIDSEYLFQGTRDENQTMTPLRFALETENVAMAEVLAEHPEIKQPLPNVSDADAVELWRSAIRNVFFRKNWNKRLLNLFQSFLKRCDELKRCEETPNGLSPIEIDVVEALLSNQEINDPDSTNLTIQEIVKLFRDWPSDQRLDVVEQAVVAACENNDTVPEVSCAPDQFAVVLEIDAGQCLTNRGFDIFNSALKKCSHREETKWVLQELKTHGHNHLVQLKKRNVLPPSEVNSAKRFSWEEFWVVPAEARHAKQVQFDNFNFD